MYHFDMADTTSFRANLRRAMLTRGLSQRGLADAAGVSQVHVNRILVGKADCSIEILSRIADALETTASALLDSEKEEIDA